MTTTHRFEMAFDLGNAAFEGEGRPGEIARILNEVAERVEGGETEGHCVDLNGNSVGTWGFDPAEEEDDAQPDCCGDLDLDSDGVCQNCGELAP